MGRVGRSQSVGDLLGEDLIKLVAIRVGNRRPISYPEPLPTPLIFLRILFSASPLYIFHTDRLRNNIHYRKASDIRYRLGAKPRTH